MKYRIFSLTITIIAAMALVLSLDSCKENTVINANVTPAIDNIHTFGLTLSDPDSLLIKQVYDDSAKTGSTVSGYSIYHGLGAINAGADAYTGNLAESIFMQVLPPNGTTTGWVYPATSGDVADSAVLVLPYGGFTWGDTTIVGSQKVNVYEINDNFPADSLYSFNNLKTNSTVIGSAILKTGKAGTGSIVDSVSVNGVNVAPHLRITLSKPWLDAFLAKFQTSPNNVDSTIASYLKYGLNGLCIAPDASNTGVAIPFFLMENLSDNYGHAGILVYGHNGTVATDSVIYSFAFNSTYNSHFNRITRKFSDAKATKLFGSLAKTDSLVMIQNQPGAAMDLRIPSAYLKSIRQHAGTDNFVINQAQLVLTQVLVGSDDKYTPPARIYPIGIDANNARYTVQDRLPVSTSDGLTFIDGIAHSVTIGGITINQYGVNVPRELQQAVIQKRSELHLRINGTSTYPGAYRIVVGGSHKDNSTYKLLMNIIYSKQ